MRAFYGVVYGVAPLKNPPKNKQSGAMGVREVFEVV